ncbi:MAG: hypothetical protein AABZ64_09780 [Nitrospinota bacterium]
MAVLAQASSAGMMQGAQAAGMAAAQITAMAQASSAGVIQGAQAAGIGAAQMAGIAQASSAGVIQGAQAAGIGAAQVTALQAASDVAGTQAQAAPALAIAGIAAPLGALAPGALPPGAFAPGALPPGALPPGAFAPGALPPGALPPGVFVAPPTVTPFFAPIFTPAPPPPIRLDQAATCSAATPASCTPEQLIALGFFTPPVTAPIAPVITAPLVTALDVSALEQQFASQTLADVQAIFPTLLADQQAALGGSAQAAKVQSDIKHNPFSEIGTRAGNAVGPASEDEAFRIAQAAVRGAVKNAFRTGNDLTSAAITASVAAIVASVTAVNAAGAVIDNTFNASQGAIRGAVLGASAVGRADLIPAIAASAASAVLTAYTVPTNTKSSSDIFDILINVGLGAGRGAAQAGGSVTSVAAAVAAAIYQQAVTRNVSISNDSTDDVVRVRARFAADGFLRGLIREGVTDEATLQTAAGAAEAAIQAISQTITPSASPANLNTGVFQGLARAKAREGARARITGPDIAAFAAQTIQTNIASAILTTLARDLVLGAAQGSQFRNEGPATQTALTSAAITSIVQAAQAAAAVPANDKVADTVTDAVGGAVQGAQRFSDLSDVPATLTSVTTAAVQAAINAFVLNGGGMEDGQALGFDDIAAHAVAGAVFGADEAARDFATITAAAAQTAVQAVRTKPGFNDTAANITPVAANALLGAVEGGADRGLSSSDLRTVSENAAKGVLLGVSGLLNPSAVATDAANPAKFAETVIDGAVSGVDESSNRSTSRMIAAVRGAAEGLMKNQPATVTLTSSGTNLFSIAAAVAKGAVLAAQTNAQDPNISVDSRGTAGRGALDGVIRAAQVVAASSSDRTSLIMLAAEAAVQNFSTTVNQNDLTDQLVNVVLNAVPAAVGAGAVPADVIRAASQGAYQGAKANAGAGTLDTIARARDIARGLFFGAFLGGTADTATLNTISTESLSALQALTGAGGQFSSDTDADVATGHARGVITGTARGRIQTATSATVESVISEVIQANAGDTNVIFTIAYDAGRGAVQGAANRNEDRSAIAKNATNAARVAAQAAFSANSSNNRVMGVIRDSVRGAISASDLSATAGSSSLPSVTINAVLGVFGGFTSGAGGLNPRSNLAGSANHAITFADLAEAVMRGAVGAARREGGSLTATPRSGGEGVFRGSTTAGQAGSNTTFNPIGGEALAGTVLEARSQFAGTLPSSFSSILSGVTLKTGIGGGVSTTSGFANQLAAVIVAARAAAQGLLLGARQSGLAVASDSSYLVSLSQAIISAAGNAATETISGLSDSISANTIKAAVAEGVALALRTLITALPDLSGIVLQAASPFSP